MLIAPGLVFLLSRPDRRDMEMHAHVHSVAVSRAAVSLHTKKEQLLIGFLQLYMASSHCGKCKAQSSTTKMRKIFFYLQREGDHKVTSEAMESPNKGTMGGSLSRGSLYVFICGGSFLNMLRLRS